MEHIRICNVCHNVYCFTDAEIEANKSNSTMTAISAIGTIASVFGGTMLSSMYLNNQTDRYASKIRDFNKCPQCGSLNTREIEDSTMNADIQDSERVESVLNRQTHNYSINSSASPEALLTRALMFLEDGDWEKVKRYCNFLLDADPFNANAYLALFMAELHVDSVGKLQEIKKPFDESRNYQRFLRFATPETKETIEAYNNAIKNEIAENAKKQLETSNRVTEGYEFVESETVETYEPLEEKKKSPYICTKCNCDLIEMGYAENEILNMSSCPICGESLDLLRMSMKLMNNSEQK